MRLTIPPIIGIKKNLEISGKTEETKIIISAIAEYLESENFEYSKSVLAAEAGFDFQEISDIKKQLGLSKTSMTILKTFFKKFPVLTKDAESQTDPSESKENLRDRIGGIPSPLDISSVESNSSF